MGMLFFDEFVMISPEVRNAANELVKSHGLTKEEKQVQRLANIIVAQLKSNEKAA
jgi:hypothetical protein